MKFYAYMSSIEINSRLFKNLNVKKTFKRDYNFYDFYIGKDFFRYKEMT